tara:strand:+ start:162 stop:563 length:402 start_codon:yes stop_codon:yes gene_type:complete
VISYREQIKFFFDKLNLTRVHWNIVAEDGTIHPFTNIDVINSFLNCPEDGLKTTYVTLNQMHGDRMKINSFLKGIATHYCDNRFTLIKALKEDYEKQTSKEGKQFFYNLLAKFTESDLEKAEVLDFWKKINSQ